MAILNATATLSGAGSLTATFPEYRLSQLGIEAWTLPNPSYRISQLGIEAWVSSHPAIFASATFNGTGTLIANTLVQNFATATFNGSGTLIANATLEMQFLNISASFNGIGTLIVNVVGLFAISATFNGAGTLIANAILSQAGTANADFSGIGVLIVNGTIIERGYGELFDGRGLLICDAIVLSTAELRVSKFNAYAVITGAINLAVSKFNAYAVVQPLPLEVTKFQGYAVIQQIPTFNCPPIPVYPTLPGLEFNVHRRPRFASLIQNGFSGRETRNFQQTLPFWEFELSYSILRDQTQNNPIYSPTAPFIELQQISGLFEFCAAQAGLFYFDDPADDSRKGQLIAVGNGTNGPYTIVRTWGSGPLGFNEPIGGINTMFNVYLNGVLQSAGAWQVEQNEITFAFPITNGVNITADFTFYYLCRFIEDQHDYEQFYKTLWSMKSVKFRSIIGPC